MGKKCRFFAMGAIALAVVGCSSKEEEPGIDNPFEPIELEPVQAEVSDALQPFAFNLLGEACRQTEGNLIISPLGATLMAGMLANAADEEASAQFLAVLGLQESQKPWLNSYCNKLLTALPGVDKASEMHLDNGIWFNNVPSGNFPMAVPTEGYKTTMGQDYLAEMSFLDFSEPGSLDKINDWIDKRVEMNNVVNKLSPENVALWVSTLHFKGAWTKKFNKEETKKRQFACENGNRIAVDMMLRHPVGAGYYFSEGRYEGKAHDSGVQAVTLPYGNEAYQFTAILPPAGMSLEALSEKLAGGMWKHITTWDNLMDKGIFGVNMPRMSIVNKHDMKPIYNAMGITGLLEGGAMPGIGIESDFSCMMSQNASIAVDEEGAELKVVTVSGGDLMANMGKVVIFDRPFVFAIWEQSTKAVIAVGAYRGADE